MEIIFKKSFLKAAKSLPSKTQGLIVSQIDIFKKNQNDARLHAKKLSGKLKNFYSLRVGRNYRVIYFFKSKKKAVFVDIGHRKDIYE